MFLRNDDVGIQCRAARVLHSLRRRGVSICRNSGTVGAGTAPIFAQERIGTELLVVTWIGDNWAYC